VWQGFSLSCHKVPHTRTGSPVPPRAGLLFTGFCAPVAATLTLGEHFGIDDGVEILIVGGHEVPGSAEECRLHALACVRLAQTLATPQGRDHYAKLARSWIKLAEDLERGIALREASRDESETREQTG
jgi:hypothetical protein